MLLNQAIIHAQCAVECLLDTYLERDWLTEQLSPKAGLKRKIELLSQRPVLQLPTVLLSEFVAEPRHDIIHRYKTRTAKDARIVVEAASSVIASLKANSDPHHGKVFAGSLLGGSFYSKEYVYHYFTGFSDSFGLTWRDSNGVVRVASGVVSNKIEAEVWWAPIQEFSLEQHLGLLSWWDSLRLGAWQSENALRERLTLAGLHIP